MDAPDDYLQMSGIQHFAFCRRQWALIHLEQQWAENLRTTEGQLNHTRCHDDTPHRAPGRFADHSGNAGDQPPAADVRQL